MNEYRSLHPLDLDAINLVLKKVVLFNAERHKGNSVFSNENIEEAFASHISQGAKGDELGLHMINGKRVGYLKDLWKDEVGNFRATFQCNSFEDFMEVQEYINLFEARNCVIETLFSLEEPETNVSGDHPVKSSIGGIIKFVLRAN